MNSLIDAFALWLADYYLLSTTLLVFALLLMTCLRQPIQKLVVAKSAVAALILLAVLCVLPGWSLIHLLDAEVSSQPSQYDDSALPQFVEYNQPDGPESALSNSSDLNSAASDGATDHKPVARTWPPLTWKTALALAHATGAACVFAWLTLGALAAHRMRRHSQPVPPETMSWINQSSGLCDTDLRHIELRTTDQVQVPVALGISRPVVLLPQKWLGNRSPAELRSVVAHELAHIRNRDLQWLAAGRVLMVLLWLQPLYWLLRRHMRLNQEALADAAAAEFTSRQHYAEQLVAWARDVVVHPALHLSSAVGLWEGPSQLRRRIALLLDDRLTIVRNCSRAWQWSAVGGCLICAMGLSLLTLQPAMSQPEIVTNGEPRPALAAPLQSRDNSNYVEVTCVDEQGQPLENVTLKVFRIKSNSGEPAHALMVSLTGSAGTHIFPRVVKPKAHPWFQEYPDGKIDGRAEHTAAIAVVASLKGHASELVAEPEYNIYRDGWKVEIAMPPGKTLKGRITDRQNNPVANAAVSVANVAVDGYQSARTDNDGHYAIDDAHEFDIEKYRQQVAAQERNLVNNWKAGTATLNLYMPRPVLTVRHANFADKKTDYDNIPGTKDVQLDPPAIVEGRVIFGESGKSAAGAQVHIATSPPDDRLPKPDAVYWFHRAIARADSDGKFQFATLPAGTYNVWAETPGWVNKGEFRLAAAAEKTTTVPDLNLIKGSVVSVRLMVAKSGERLELPPDARAQVLAEPLELRMTGRALFNSNSEATDGKFIIETLPGQNRIHVGGVTLGSGEARWVGSDAVEVKITGAEPTNVDMPVVAIEAPPIQTGVFVAAPVEIARLDLTENPRAAVEKLTRDLKDRPNDIDALIPRAEAWQRLGEYDKAVADYERVIGMQPTGLKSFIVHNNLAYLLSAAPDESIRNGKRAVELAQKAREIQPHPSAEVLDTLAAAYAEAGDFEKAIATQQLAIEMRPENEGFRKHLTLYENQEPLRESRPQVEQPSIDQQGARQLSGTIRLVQGTTSASGQPARSSRPPALLSYGDAKADGKKSYGGNGHMIRFELPDGITKVRGIRIHASRYGYPQAHQEDAEITFLSENRDETLHTERAPYRMFKRGKESWVRIMFDQEVELPKNFWIALNFNAEQTKGVYVSYDTSTNGQYSRVGLPGDEEEPKETDFAGDWMIQVMLARPK